MKKFLFPLALVTLIPVMLSACSSHSHGDDKNKFSITYGREYLSSEKGTLNDITYADLQMKMMNTGSHYKENFLLATYDKGGGCSCWSGHFEIALKGLSKEYGYEVYTIANEEFVNEQGKEKEDFGLYHFANQSKPTLAIVKKGSIIKQFIYDSSIEMFSDSKALKREIEAYVKSPQLVKVSENCLDDIIFTNPRDEFVVYYMREKCGDCSYISPATIWPYACEKTFAKKMYVIDIDPIRDSNKEIYAKFKIKHLLADENNNTGFGYSEGVVPTLQYWKNGTLESATVTFNDEITKDSSGKLYVSNSFYTEERKEKLDYAQDLRHPVLKGLEVDPEDVDDYTEYGYGYVWKQDAAFVYHKPLLEAFLDKHLLK